MVTTIKTCFQSGMNAALLTTEAVLRLVGGAASGALVGASVGVALKKLEVNVSQNAATDGAVFGLVMGVAASALAAVRAFKMRELDGDRAASLIGTTVGVLVAVAFLDQEAMMCHRADSTMGVIIVAGAVYGTLAAVAIVGAKVLGNKALAVAVQALDSKAPVIKAEEKVLDEKRV